MKKSATKSTQVKKARVLSSHRFEVAHLERADQIAHELSSRTGLRVTRADIINKWINEGYTQTLNEHEQQATSTQRQPAQPIH